VDTAQQVDIQGPAHVIIISMMLILLWMLLNSWISRGCSWYKISFYDIDLVVDTVLLNNWISRCLLILLCRFSGFGVYLVLNGSKLGLVKPIQTLGLTLGRGISSDGLCRLWD
jgi:hypothetical protein